MSLAQSCLIQPVRTQPAWKPSRSGKDSGGEGDRGTLQKPPWGTWAAQEEPHTAMHPWETDPQSPPQKQGFRGPLPQYSPSALTSASPGPCKPSGTCLGRGEAPAPKSPVPRGASPRALLCMAVPVGPAQADLGHRRLLPTSQPCLCSGWRRRFPGWAGRRAAGLSLDFQRLLLGGGRTARGPRPAEPELRGAQEAAAPPGRSPASTVPVPSSRSPGMGGRVSLLGRTGSRGLQWGRGGEWA